MNVIVFSDFQCPYCRNLARILADVWGTPGDRRAHLEFRNFPLPMHSWARPAAEDAACVSRQDGVAFWRVHDRIFNAQSSLTDDNIHQRILEFASDTGIDVGRFRRCVDQAQSLSRVLDDTELAQHYGVSATPTLIINGRRAPNFRTAAQLRTFIADLVR